MRMLSGYWTWCANRYGRRVLPHGPALTLALVAALLASGCSVLAEFNQASGPLPIQAGPIEGARPLAPDHEAVVERQAVKIPTPPPSPRPQPYRVGPTDTLYLNVNGQPDMSTVAPGNIGTSPIGARVDGNGDIQLPAIGRVHVAGMTRAEIQDLLVGEYRRFIRDPWVLVEILEFRSHPIYLVGEFNSAGVVYMDRPLNVLQAVAMGSGTNERAYLQGARLLRNNQVVPVDLYDLLRHGAMDQNVWLEPYDTLYVPDNVEQVVFVLGQVGEPGPVRMRHGKLTLTEAIAQAGDFRTVESNLEGVRLIRSHSPTRGELMVVDLTRILRGEALPLPLMPGDIVYIPKNKAGDWNDAVREIAPTVELFSGAVSPFVLLVNAL